MCLFPVSIPNPYLAGRFSRTGRSVVRTSDRLRSASPTLEVPCGKCTECLSRRYSDLLQRCYVESLTSYVFMVTLTYSPRCVPTLDLSVVDSVPGSRPGKRPRCMSSIVPIYYADYSHLQSLFKRLRFDPLFSDRDFRYFVVTEYGSERMRPHFHILFYVARLDSDDPLYGSTLESALKPLFKRYFSENIGTRKSPIYVPYFDEVSRFVDGKLHSTFDLHLVRPRDESGIFIDGDSTSSAATVCSYVLSYVNKSSRFESYVLDNYKRFSRFLDSNIADRFRSILQCRCSYSHQFGFGFDTRTGKRVVPVRPAREVLTLTSSSRSELFASLPDSFDEFRLLYPDLADDYDAWWTTDALDKSLSFRYSDFHTFYSFYGSVVDIYFVVALKYHPERPDMFVRYHRWSKTFSFAGLSFRPYSSSSNDSYFDSVSYKFLSSCVRRSVAESNFFSVTIVDEKGPRVLPMCSYFKSYFVSDSDILALYDRLGCSDLDDYLRCLSIHQRPYADRLARSAAFNQDNSFLEDSRFSFHRRLQNCANYIAYSKNLFIFAPDITRLCDSTPLAGSVGPADLASLDRQRSARFRRIRRVIDKMLPLYEKTV